jgi:hypothetical protein
MAPKGLKTGWRKVLSGRKCKQPFQNFTAELFFFLPPLKGEGRSREARSGWGR